MSDPSIISGVNLIIFGSLWICLVSFMWYKFSQRLKAIDSYLAQGYYIIEFYGVRHIRGIVRTRGENVDKSDPCCPRVIDPQLLEYD